MTWDQIAAAVPGFIIYGVLTWLILSWAEVLFPRRNK